jgi:translation initiation factor IF-2
LISELRSMLEPLLAATGGQPALAQQLAALAGQPAPAPAPAPAPVAPAAPMPVAPMPVAVSPLPQRTRFASELRPRVTAADLAMPGARSAPMSIPRLSPGVDDNSQGPASDGEDAWW